MRQPSRLLAKVFKKTSHQRRPLAKVTLTCVALTCALISISSKSEITESLPLLGDPVSAIVSPSDEIVLGRAYLRALRNQMPMIQDPPLNDYIRNLTMKIVASSDSEIPPIRTAMINSSAINAFAVPGGILGLNAGLFLYATTEGELAAVLAHELAHLSQRHYARGIEHREKTKWATYTGLLASLALLATSDSSTGIASILATQAVTIDANLQFSRQNEREADRVGMETLFNAGFDPRAMPGFFGRLLQSKQFSGTEDYEFLNTHPVTQSRISDSQARADQLTSQLSIMEQSRLFYYMQARIAAAYASTPQEAVAQFKSKLKKNKNHKAYRYGLARAYLRNQQFDKALNTIQNKGKLQYKDMRLDNSTALEFGLVEIEIYLEKEEFDLAYSKISALMQKYPNQISLRYYRAKSTLGLQRDVEAITLLNDLLRSDAENLLYLESLLIANRRQFNQTATLQTQARISFARGRYGKARKHYQQALMTINDNLPLQAKIEHELQRITQLELKLRQFSR